MRRSNEFRRVSAVFLALVFASMMIFKTWTFFKTGPENLTEKTIGPSPVQLLTTTYANEHLPKWVKKFPSGRPEFRVELLEGAGVVTIENDEGRYVRASADLQKESQLRIHKFYYPGWIVHVDGKKIDISFDNDFGVIDMHVPQGRHIIEAQFVDTAFRQTLNIISLAAYVIVLIPLFFPRKDGWR